MSDVYYWDACVFLSYINGVEDRLPIIDDLFSKARTAGCQIVTSTWSITEVAYETSEKGTRILQPDVEKRIDSLWADRAAVKLVDVYELLQRDARRLMREGIQRGWNLKPVDAVHLATAISAKASEFHTYDGGLQKYEEIIGFPVCEPNSKQGVLLMTPSRASIAAAPDGK